MVVCIACFLNAEFGGTDFHQQPIRLAARAVGRCARQPLKELLKREFRELSKVARRNLVDAIESKVHDDIASVVKGKGSSIWGRLNPLSGDQRSISPTEQDVFKGIDLTKLATNLASVFDKVGNSDLDDESIEQFVESAVNNSITNAPVKPATSVSRTESGEAELSDTVKALWQ